MADPTAAAREAALLIASRTGVTHHDTAVIVGSGWFEAIELLGKEEASLRAGEVPGFDTSTVAGHGQGIRSVTTKGGKHVLAFGARRHFYEGRDAVAVAHAVRTAAASGCTTLILTNAAGSIRPEWTPGTLVLVSDHINLTGATPLVGPRFVDMTDAYSPRLREIAREIDRDLPEGVYAQFMGPQYETPAEIRAAAALGADLVGMSTALETIAARAEGLDVLALSLVTNLATGITTEPVSHEGVLATGVESSPRLATFVSSVIDRIPARP